MARTVEFTRSGVLNSSAIDFFWYDGKNQHLFVRFADTDRIAGYQNVPQARVDELVGAYSIGSYYSSYIKGRYTGLNSDVTFVEATPNVAPLTVVHTGDVPKQNFVVSGTVTAEVRDTIEASSMEQAIQEFRDSFVDGTEVLITKVEVSSV